MAKITITEAVHISTQLDGEAINLDLIPGDIEVADHVAEILIAQNFAAPFVKGGKKTAPVEPTPIAETPEA